MPSDKVAQANEKPLLLGNVEIWRLMLAELSAHARGMKEEKEAENGGSLVLLPGESNFARSLLTPSWMQFPPDDKF